MIAENRDRAFWVRIASHPMVEKALLGLDPQEIGDIAANPEIMPLASVHGGFLVSRAAGLGLVCEAHVIFTPEGWGKEVHQATKEAIEVVFRSAQIITTFEVDGLASSIPARSFGFRLASDFQTTPLGRFRTWFLTKDVWERSSARSRLCRQSS